MPRKPVKMELYREIGDQEITYIVTGDYYPGTPSRGYYDPPDYPCLDGLTVTLNGEDVTDSFSEKELNKIGDEYIEYIKETGE